MCFHLVLREFLHDGLIVPVAAAAASAALFLLNLTASAPATATATATTVLRSSRRVVGSSDGGRVTELASAAGRCQEVFRRKTGVGMAAVGGMIAVLRGARARIARPPIRAPASACDL